MLKPSLIKGKNVLLRADLDVPLEGGRVANDFRLQALLPTLKLCLENAQSTLIIGHLGRPTGPDPAFGLKPVQEWLERALNQSIFFISSGFSPGEWARGQSPLAMFDNLRFHLGELTNDREFAKQLSAGSDIYIYEAFAAYNEAASLRIIPEIIPTYPGFRFEKEVEELGNILKNRLSPSLLVISGAKEDKVKYVDNLVDKFDEILVGGKLASLVSLHANIVPASFTPDGFDIDPTSIALFSGKILAAKSVVISGPLGRFEDGQHAAGTKAILAAAKRSPARIVIGGGDTLAAIPALGFAYTDFDFVSTGGGAMLEFLATGTHPLLEVIKKQPFL